MQINFTVWATGTALSSNKLRYIAYEAETPSAEVARITEDPPHTFPHAVTLNVPNPVVHIVKIFSTPDESAGTLITDFIYDPTYTNVEVRMPLQLIAGGGGEFDPDEDSNQIVIPDLVEWEGLWYPERRANGGTMATYEYTILAGKDGFELVGDDTFADGELIWIHFSPKITVSQPTFNYLNLFTGYNTITGDVTIDSTHYRKLNEIVAAGTTAPVITLQKLEDVPNQTLLVFETFMGNQRQVKFITQSGQPIKANNGNRTSICLGVNAYIWFLKVADGYRIVSSSEDLWRVGAQVDSDVLLPNTLWLDGGGMLISEYPRTYEYVNALPAGQLLTKADRDAGGISKAGFWAIDEATGMIFRPDYRGLTPRFLPGNRGNDSGRDAASLTGSYDPDAMANHHHFTAIDQGFDTGGFPDTVGRAVTAIRSIIKRWSKTSGGGKESTFLAGADADFPGLQPAIGPTSYPQGTTTATENKVKTVGVKRLVYV
jgi:hypothetical protein